MLSSVAVFIFNVNVPCSLHSPIATHPHAPTAVAPELVRPPHPRVASRGSVGEGGIGFKQSIGGGGGQRGVPEGPGQGAGEGIRDAERIAQGGAGEWLVLISTKRVTESKRVMVMVIVRVGVMVRVVMVMGVRDAERIAQGSTGEWLAIIGRVILIVTERMNGNCHGDGDGCQRHRGRCAGKRWCVGMGILILVVIMLLI